MSAMAAQSPELIDEPPISDIALNRAVRRPMSLSEFSSTPTSPQFLGYRHSMYATGRRPLRSSPLAGPALRLDEPIEEVDEEKNQQSYLPRPSRVLSTPNLATLLTPPPPLRNARPKTAESFQEGLSHVSTSSPPAKPSKRPSSLFSKRRTSEIVPPLQPSSSSLLQSRSVSSLSFRYYPTKDGRLRGNNSEKEPLTPPPPALQRHRSAHDCPTIRHRHITTIPEKDCIIPPTHTHYPKDNSWFTANTYQVTPKFSRLGLAAPGVVLPVSAKEYKRLSRHSSGSSMSAGTPNPGVLRPMDNASSLSPSSPASSTPDANLNDMQHDSSSVTTPTLTRSSASSWCSDQSSITPSDINSIPVVAASMDSVTTITTVMDGDELAGSLPLSKDRDEQEPQSQKIAAAISSKKNKSMRFKILQYRTSTKSLNHVYHTSINQQSKEDHPESYEKKKGNHNRGTANRSHEIKLGLVKFSWFTSSKLSLSDPSNGADSKRDQFIAMKESSSVKKRLWKSIAVNW